MRKLGRQNVIAGAIRRLWAVLATPFLWLGSAGRDPVTGLVGRAQITHLLDLAIAANSRKTMAIGAVAVEIDDFRDLEENLESRELNTAINLFSKRLTKSLREGDVVGRLERSRFAVALSPLRRLDLEAAIKISTRIQHAMVDPIPIGDTKVQVTASTGFALAERIDKPSGDTLVQSACIALLEAQRDGPNAIRSFSNDMRERVRARSSLARDIGDAMHAGDIQAYFQPQINIKDGRLSGFEALARWNHPQRGLISPAEFLPVLEQTGTMGQLGELMLRNALTAMQYWDREGLFVPQVSINISNAELHNPRLVDHISMELDRFGLSPERLVIEVLETVVASGADNRIVQNLAQLSKMGCTLDLDDFGTGHASITSIRRFAINRIKVDRSFITNIDSDPEQQQMFAAIMTMADRLGLDTLAEGVETAAEMRHLVDAGCGFLQGFHLSRPLSLEQTTLWIKKFAQNGSTPAPLRRVV